MQHFLAMLHRSFAHCCLNYLKGSFQECRNPVSPAYDMYSICLATPDSRQCPGCGQQRLCRDQTRCHNDHWSLAPTLELQTTVHTKVRNDNYQGLHLVHQNQLQQQFKCLKSWSVVAPSSHHQVSTPLQPTQTTLSKTSFTVMKNDARRWIVEKIL